jgi:NAD(P)-dependent dehydrogenase (short-subunit alcohol dehydrogenase family)
MRRLAGGLVEKLEGRVAVVTGASTGIGRAAARSFAQQGMKVVLASQNAERLAAATDDLAKEGFDVLGVPTDIGDEAQVFALADKALEVYGAVHVLVNNAAVFAPGYMWDIPGADWRWVVDVNLWGPIHGIRAFVPHMLDLDEAHVVNVSSAGGLMPAGVHGPYCTTKHAVVGLSKALRADLGIKGANVGVTVVCPGAVKTAITSQLSTNGPGGIPRGTVDLPPEVDAAFGSILSYTDAGIPADGVGDMIVDAVRGNHFWLLPNAEVFFPVLDQQLEDLKAGR